MALDLSVINPRVIFVSATTPSDVTEGKMWYDTTNNELKVSDGSSYVSVEPDTDNLNQFIQENAINILVNSAGASTTLNDWDEMVLDRFTDADGQLNTIDTGNTTSTFSTNKYTNSSSLNETGEIAESSPNTETTYKDFTSINDYVTSVDGTIKGAGAGNFDLYVQYYYSDATDSGKLTAGTVNTTSYETVTQNNPSPEKEVDHIVVSFKSRTGGTTMYCNNSNVYLAPANNLVQTNAQTITTGATHVQVYSNNTTAGSGSITADISVDGGSTYTTDIPLNTKTPITSTDGTSIIMKLNLNGVGAGNTSEAEDYAIMLFY